MLTFSFISQIIVDGLIAGSIYMLLAIGLTLVFGVLGIANFAHGEFYMLGGYFGIIISTKFNFGFFESLLLVLFIIGIVALLIDRLIFLPLKNQEMTNTIIVSFGLSVMLQNIALLVFGPEPQIFKTSWSSIPVEIGDIYLTLSRAIIPIFVISISFIMFIVLKYTWSGRALQALSQNTMIAELCGINIDKIAIITFMIGAIFAGFAGILMSSIFVVQPSTGNMVVLKAFTVVILGGLGSISGAAIAGLLLGIVEVFTAALINNLAKDIVAFVIVIIMLMIRPQGL